MKKIAIVLTLLVILGAAYCGAWLYMKKIGEAEIDRVFAQSGQKDFRFTGAKPRIEGFPFVPRLTYTDGVEVRNWQASFSTMTVSGYPIPGMPITIRFPAGVIAWMDEDREPVAIENLTLTVKMPWPLPASLSENDMRAWSQNGGELHVTDSLIVYDGLETQADGIFTLDAAMQLKADLMARTKGYASFIQKMTEAERIKPIAGIALLAALNNFAEPDPDSETGEMVAELPVTIRDRGLYVGPVLVEEIPEIVWGTHNPPALHQ